MAMNGQNLLTNAHNFKVVLLGEGCVGKTSLVLRYVENKFNDKHFSTVQVQTLNPLFIITCLCLDCLYLFRLSLQASFLVKKLNIGGRRINLSIWDTAGQEKFHALGPIYYRGSNGAILVYDITDQNSFQMVKNWVKELRKMLGAEICLVIAGNKTDLERDRHVTIEEAET